VKLTTAVIIEYNRIDDMKWSPLAAIFFALYTTVRNKNDY
jgi:hypothetical protein